MGWVMSGRLSQKYHSRGELPRCPLHPPLLGLPVGEVGGVLRSHTITTNPKSSNPNIYHSTMYTLRLETLPFQYCKHIMDCSVQLGQKVMKHPYDNACH